MRNVKLYVMSMYAYIYIHVYCTVGAHIYTFTCAHTHTSTYYIHTHIHLVYLYNSLSWTCWSHSHTNISRTCWDLISASTKQEDRHGSLATKLNKNREAFDLLSFSICGSFTHTHKLALHPSPDHPDHPDPRCFLRRIFRCIFRL